MTHWPLVPSVADRHDVEPLLGDDLVIRGHRVTADTAGLQLDFAVMAGEVGLIGRRPALVASAGRFSAPAPPAGPY